MPPDPAEPVVAVLAEVWESVAAAGVDLDAEAWDRPTDCPGWSVRDQYSHLIGIERSLMGDAAPVLDGPVPGHVRNPFAEMNEAWVAERRGRPGPEVLAEFRAVTARRLEGLRAASTEDFDRVGWSPVGDVPYREFMAVRVFDSWIHEQDIRRALDRPGGRGGAGEALSLDRVTSFLGYALGRKVAPPEGTTVLWVVRGPLPRTVGLEMREGRARPLADPPGSPTLRLDLPAEAFWRLGCGRLAPAEAEAVGGVRVTGDADLARRVLEAMNVMF